MLAPGSTGIGYENGLHRGDYRTKTKKCTPGIRKICKAMNDQDSDDGIDELLAKTTKKLSFVLEDNEEDRKENMAIDFCLEVEFEDEETNDNEETEQTEIDLRPKTPTKKVGMHDISTLFFDLNLDLELSEDSDEDSTKMKMDFGSNNNLLPIAKYNNEQKDESPEYERDEHNDNEQKEINISPNNKENEMENMDLSALQSSINVKRPQTAPLRSRKRNFATMDGSDDDEARDLLFELNSPKYHIEPAKKRKKVIQT